MTAKKLTKHLHRIRIQLVPCEKKSFGRWKTSPLGGYPFPSNWFQSLKLAREHWRREVFQRLMEVEAARLAWSLAKNKEERDQLLAWARGSECQIPEILIAQLEKRPTQSARCWMKAAENLSSKYGCAAFSWLHAAVLDAAIISKEDVCSEIIMTMDREHEYSALRSLTTAMYR